MEILEEENSIILEASEKLVALGSTAAQNAILGKTSKVEDDKAHQIIQLLHVYENKASLSDDNLESVLYALRQLSGAFVFPTIDPIVGQELEVIMDEEEAAAGVATSQFRGDVSVQSGNMPSAAGGTGTGGIYRAGDHFRARITDPGSPVTIDSVIIYDGTMFLALVDSPGNTMANWYQM